MTTQPTDYKAEAREFRRTGKGAYGCPCDDVHSMDIDLAALLERLCGEAREEGFRQCDGQWQMAVGFAITGMEREKAIAQVREEARREMGQKIEGLIRDRLGPAYFDIVEHMLREAKP